jgi:hypothetical protein
VGFSGASSTSYGLIKWLRENANDNGRVFFYIPDGGAHKTPLEGQLPFYQVATQRAVMGVPAGAMPKEAIEWIQTIGECLDDPKSAATCGDLYNIHYAIAFGPNGSQKALPLAEANDVSSNFRLVKTIDSIQIYEARQKSSYFLIGKGEVNQYLNRISITAEPSEFVVLKFFWVPGLRANPPLLLEPYPLPNGRAFIKVHSNFDRHFDIVYGKSGVGVSTLRQSFSSFLAPTVR